MPESLPVAPESGVRYPPMPGDWTCPACVLARILPVGHSMGMAMGRITEGQLRNYAALGAVKAPARITRTADGYTVSVELRAQAKVAFAALVRGTDAAEGDELVWFTKQGEPRRWADLNLLVAKLDELLPDVDLLLVRREPRVIQPRRKDAAQPEEEGNASEDQ